MKLSVIVPVYNMASDGKLNYCLNSLVNQTLPENSYEIIAVDDCSTDNSFDIMKEYERRFPDKFKAIHSPVNHHQGGAKNIGLSMAQGEWIGFIDADDWVKPYYYEKLLQKAEETGADMVGCDYQLTYEHSMKPGQSVPNNNEEQTGIMTEDKYKKLLLDTGSLVVKIYKRNIIFGDQDYTEEEIQSNIKQYTQIKCENQDKIHEEVSTKQSNIPFVEKEEVGSKQVDIPSEDKEETKPRSANSHEIIDITADEHIKKIFPEDIFYEDNAISNTWMLRVKHFEYIPEPMYFYYQHDASTVHTISRKNLEDRIVAGRMILQEAKDHNYLDTYKDEIEFMYTILFYVNTLFSAMPKEQHISDAYSFCKALGEEMKQTFPDFQDNKYYQERVHAEEKKLIKMQMKSHLMFFTYYRLLWFYRNLRKKK